MKTSSRRSRVAAITIMVLLPIVVLTFLVSADTTRAEPADVLELGFNEEFDSPTLDPAWHVVEFTGTRSYDYTSPANHFSLSDSPGHDDIIVGANQFDNGQTDEGRAYVYYGEGCVAPPAGLVSWWTGDGHANDIVGSNHGSLQNGATYGPGLVGQAFHFDGVDDYVLVPNSSSLTISDQFTMDFWFRPEVTINPADPIAHGLWSKGYYEFIGTANSDGWIEVRGPTPGAHSLTNTWMAGTWYHVAVTLDATGYRLYINGVEEGSSPSSYSILDNSNAILFSRSQGTNFFNGDLDEVSLFNRTLAAAEIQAIYDADSAGKCKGVVVPPTTVYVSSNTSGTAGGVTFADEDVLAHDLQTGLWYMVLDGSDVGLDAADVDAFSLQPDGSLLLSLDNPLVVGSLGLVDDSDIVRFRPTSLGPTTAGTFEWFWDASLYGLAADSEDVDALAFAPDGRLLVSTIGNLSAGGLTAQDEDLSALDMSTGVWSLYFDGVDVGLAELSSEDVYGAAVDGATGDIYLTTLGAFDVPGASGDGADIFICAPGALGDTTSCTYTLFWDGSAHGFGGEVMDALEVGFTTAPMLWASTQTQLVVGGLTFNDEDIFAYDPALGVYALVFDGSDVGVTGDVDAFSRLAEGSLLLSLDTAADIPGLGLVDDSDILIFTPTALGQTTAGTLAVFLDGSAYDLETDEEDIDALTFAPDGRLVVSTLGKLTVNNLTAQDEDLSALNLSTGVWSLYFDGSDVGLMELTTEDVNGAWVNATASQVYLTTVGAFDVPGVIGDGSDILLCQVGSLGNATSCTYSLYWDGSAHGVTSVLDGLELILP